MRPSKTFALAAGVAAVVFAVAGCRQKPTGDLSAIDRKSHGIFLTIDTGGHAECSCQDCHDPASRTFAVFDCIRCHAGVPTDAIHASANMGSGSQGCYGCHRSGGAMDPAVHGVFFPIGAGTRHAGAACVNCHADATSRKIVTCNGCHAHDATPTTARHRAVAAFTYDAATCLACHADGQVNRVAAHAAFPITTGAHATSGCLACHTTSRLDKPAGRDFAKFECTGCHQATTTNASHAGLPGYAFDSASCFSCHGGGAATVDRATHTAKFFPIAAGTPHAAISCAGCHASGYSTFDCATCHTAASTDPVHAGVTGYSRASTACLACHSAGAAVDTTAHSASFFPISAGSVHAGSSCASCHSDPANRKVLDCTTCHAATAMTTAHAIVGGFTTSGQACVTCHAESQVARVADHRPFVISSGSHYRRSCLQCHPSVRADKAWAQDFEVSDCLGCHGKSSTDRQHAGRSGYAWTTSACLTCHPSGRG